MKILLVIVLALFVVLVGPFLSVWALNTLFPSLAIPYTIETWFAAFCLHAVFKSEVSFKK
jgi:hypothetical protein